MAFTDKTEGGATFNRRFSLSAIQPGLTREDI